ncbi:MAG: peptide-methionine (R)-S-oxide reductase MsrB [Sphingomicrobium sp.]
MKQQLDRRQLLGAIALGSIALIAQGAPVFAKGGQFRVSHSPAEWKKILGPKRYSILREAGTEIPYTSPLNKEHRKGLYSCAACDQKLYSSATKFDSHTGWPSFWKPLPGGVVNRTDSTFGMARTEVLCARCGGHLGHVFNDGPKPTGLRYCMNGLAMKFAVA